MNLCANVICASRPNYLYVTLDGVFRNNIIPDVYVYIDILSNGRLYQYWVLEHIENGGEHLALCSGCDVNIREREHENCFSSNACSRTDRR